MRRMLDPKEAGGNSTLYCHNIRVQGSNSQEVSLDLYTKSETAFTNSSFLEYMQGKRMSCSGRILRNEKFYNACFIYGFRGSLYCGWYDLASIEGNALSFDYFTINDQVYPVE